MLCFTDSNQGFRFRAIRINGAIVTWAKDLISQIREPGSIDPQVIALLARELSSKLAAST